MQVVATEAFKTYYQMLCIDVAKGDTFDGPFAEFLHTGGSPVRDLDGEPEPDPPAALDINGTAKDVLAWVGDNPDRAREAKAAESDRDKPRSTLLAKLDEIAGA